MSFGVGRNLLGAETGATLRRWTEGPRPGFALDAVGGGSTALAQLRGQVVLLHFFATWCEPCLEELPALDRLAGRAAGRGVSVLAISVAEVDDRVRRFFERTPVRYAVLLDRDRAVTKAWGVGALPTTIVLDGALRPRLVVEQDFDWDGVEPDALRALVALKSGITANETGG